MQQENSAYRLTDSDNELSSKSATREKYVFINVLSKETLPRHSSDMWKRFKAFKAPYRSSYTLKTFHILSTLTMILKLK